MPLVFSSSQCANDPNVFQFFQLANDRKRRTVLSLEYTCVVL